MTGDTLMIFTALGATFPASGYATLDLRNNHPVLDFDGATDEEAYFESVMPSFYASGSIAIDLYVAFTSATSGTVRFQTDFERINDGGPDLDADSFSATFQSAGGSANGTSGILTKITITHTNVQTDGLLTGEPFRLKVRRDADGTSGTDDIATDAELVRVVVREA
jgi:hypothetical protein